MVHKKGFTLIELLVVISIIGLLSTLGAVSLNSARQRSRDARRVADMKNLPTALELYFDVNSVYPVEASAVSLAVTANKNILCSSSASFAGSCAGGNTYMTLTTPAAPGCSDAVSVANVAENYSYISADGSTYTVTFCLETGVGAFASAGDRTLTPAGIQ